MNCKGSSVVLSFFMRPLPLVFDSRLVETIFFFLYSFLVACVVRRYALFL